MRATKLLPENADLAGLGNPPLRPRRTPNHHGIFPGTFPEPATPRTVLTRPGARRKMPALLALCPKCKRLHVQLGVRKNIDNALMRP
jgi:hypothetical protein